MAPIGKGRYMMLEERNNANGIADAKENADGFSGDTIHDFDFTEAFIIH